MRTLSRAAWLCSSSHCQASAGMPSGPGALLCASSFSALVMGVRSTAAAGWMGLVGPVYGVGGAAQWESRRYSAKVWACCKAGGLAL